MEFTSRYLARYSLEFEICVAVFTSLLKVTFLGFGAYDSFYFRIICLAFGVYYLGFIKLFPLAYGCLWFKVYGSMHLRLNHIICNMKCETSTMIVFLEAPIAYVPRAPLELQRSLNQQLNNSGK